MGEISSSSSRSPSLRNHSKDSNCTSMRVGSGCTLGIRAYDFVGNAPLDLPLVMVGHTSENYVTWAQITLVNVGCGSGGWATTRAERPRTTKLRGRGALPSG